MYLCFFPGVAFTRRFFSSFVRSGEIGVRVSSVLLCTLKKSSSWCLIGLSDGRLVSYALSVHYYHHHSADSSTSSPQGLFPQAPSSSFSFNVSATSASSFPSSLSSPNISRGRRFTLVLSNRRVMHIGGEPLMLSLLFERSGRGGLFASLRGKEEGDGTMAADAFTAESLQWSESQSPSRGRGERREGEIGRERDQERRQRKSEKHPEKEGQKKTKNEGQDGRLVRDEATVTQKEKKMITTCPRNKAAVTRACICRCIYSVHTPEGCEVFCGGNRPTLINATQAGQPLFSFFGLLKFLSLFLSFFLPFLSNF